MNVPVRPDQARLSRADVGIHAHRVIVGVIASRSAVIAKQGWNRLVPVRGVGQQANLLFVRLIGHHVGSGKVAIVAAQAEQDAADFSAAAGDAGGQNFDVLPAVAKLNCFAIQWAGVLAPQCIAAGVCCAAVTGAE